MTEQRRTLLHDLDNAPVGAAPVEHLVSGARAARRRKQRTFIGGAAAVTAVAVGGGFLATSGVAGGDGDRNSNDTVIADAAGRDLAVRVEVGVPGALATFLADQPGRVAAWDPEARTLAFVPDLGYSSSCPPMGSAEVTGSGTVTVSLRANASDNVCRTDSTPVSVTVDGLTTAPSEVTVTADGDTSTVPVETFADDQDNPLLPASSDTTGCDQVRLPEGGLGEADFNVDKQGGVLSINFSETRGGTYRNITYTVEYRTDPTCASTPAMADLIFQVTGYDVASTDSDMPPSPTGSDEPTLLCDPGKGTPQPQPGCPEPRPTTGWLTVTESGDIVIRHFQTLHNDADGKAYARREGLEFPFANDYLDVPDGSSQTLQLTADTACSGINQVDYRSPLADHPVACVDLIDAAEAHRVPVAIWRDGPTIVQVSELYRP